LDESVECKMPVSFEDWFVEFNGCAATSLALARSRGTTVVCCGAGSIASIDEELGVLLVPCAGQGNSNGGKGMKVGVGDK